MTHSTARLDANRLQIHAPTRSRNAIDKPPFASAGSLAALLIPILLAACGGAGGGSETPSTSAAQTAAAAPAAAAASAASGPQSTLSGKVAAVPVPVNVTVQLVDPNQADKSITLTTTAQSDGSFSLSAPTVVIPKNSQIAAVVTADGYLPTTIVYATSATGATTAVSVTNALGTLPIAGPVILTPVAAGTFAFPGLETLKRLGDGYAPGSVNSQLQLPPPPAGQPLVMLASQRVLHANASKTRLNVNLLVRGLEASACPGAQIVLRTFDSAGVEMPQQAKPMTDTPTTGDFASQSFAFDLNSAVLVGGEYLVQVSTAFCGNNDYDDMEFVGVTGTLN